MSAALPRV
ncbi:hypothetical protein E2C01_061570 [Portunus trituberculatus]|uniref:Uncharacterized protein n=1 Tax=Portunus trituberculatus TaxID=210409 RepID=A0A5B7HCR6_PORTR|nr:hypothetical protein [Portunus trituberculatus]